MARTITQSESKLILAAHALPTLSHSANGAAALLAIAIWSRAKIATPPSFASNALEEGGGADQTTPNP